MSEAHPIRNKIIAGVATGLILAVLSQLWSPARRLLSMVWGALSTVISLPLWAVVLLFGSAVAGLVALIRSRSHTPAVADEVPHTSTASREEFIQAAPSVPAVPSRVPGSEATSGLPRLSSLERDLLRRIARDDGEPVYQDTLKRSLGTSKLRIEEARDRLIELDFVEALQEGEEEEDLIALALTPGGRKYVIDQGLD